MASSSSDSVSSASVSSQSSVSEDDVSSQNESSSPKESSGVKDSASDVLNESASNQMIAQDQNSPSKDSCDGSVHNSNNTHVSGEAFNPSPQSLHSFVRPNIKNMQVMTPSHYPSSSSSSSSISSASSALSAVSDDSSVFNGSEDSSLSSKRTKSEDYQNKINL